MEYFSARHSYKETGSFEPKAAGKKTVKHAYAKGGHVHSDVAEDKALIRKEVKRNALKRH